MVLVHMPLVREYRVAVITHAYALQLYEQKVDGLDRELFLIISSIHFIINYHICLIAISVCILQAIMFKLTL